MDYRDRFAVCAHCGKEFREPAVRCPQCGADPHSTRRGAVTRWAEALVALSALIVLLFHRGA